MAYETNNIEYQSDNGEIYATVGGDKLISELGIRGVGEDLKQAIRESNGDFVLELPPHVSSAALPMLLGLRKTLVDKNRGLTLRASDQVRELLNVTSLSKRFQVQPLRNSSRQGYT